MNEHYGAGRWILLPLMLSYQISGYIFMCLFTAFIALMWYIVIIYWSHYNSLLFFCAMLSFKLVFFFLNHVVHSSSNALIVLSPYFCLTSVCLCLTILLFSTFKGAI